MKREILLILKRGKPISNLSSKSMVRIEIGGKGIFLSLISVVLMKKSAIT